MANRDHIVVLEVLQVFLLGMLFDTLLILESLKNKRQRVEHERTYSITERIPHQISHLNGIIKATDKDCIDNLRLGRDAFGRLCILLKNLGGLSDTRGVTVQEQVALFLSVISHHKKNRIVKHDFKCSGRTVSIHFNNVLEAVLKLHPFLVVKPVPVDANSTDERWKWFKGCLGALDGTYIPVKVGDLDKARYRSRKGQVCVNVLAVCDRSMNFVYILTGWEGSAADGRVLRDAVERPNGFKVPRGNYYLCDAGYTNGEGFLAPYRGVRYHLQEWADGTGSPQNARELYNLRHSKARNIIERAFAILKTRWAILRSQSFYPIRSQNQIIMACCLLHNFIRREMVVDPIEEELTDEPPDIFEAQVDFIPHVETSPGWTNWRDTLAEEMFVEWAHVWDTMNIYCLQTGSQVSMRTGYKHRSWTMLEERLLLVAFQEIMSQGWKTPNGFRNGFLLQLEQKLKISIPGTDLRAEPMISSKYGTWKKTYRDVAQVLSNSGFNWNSGTKTIDAFPHVWDAWCSAHPTLAYVREKPFPFYETWVEIYGKDRATGNDAMDFQGASNSANAPIQNHSEEVQENCHVNQSTPEEYVAQSESTTPKSSTAPAQETRKRKRVESTDDLIEVISQMWSNATSELKNVATRMGTDYDSAQNRKLIYAAIGKLPINIFRADQLQATYVLAMNTKAMDVFFGLDDEAKCDMVRMALEGRIKE